jgi:SAM-dependent methyltransferase
MTFPRLYHIHHQQYTDDLPFWLRLADQSPGPILELGCGTGRVLLPLADAGHTVYGLDNDPEMLAFLGDRLPANAAARVHLVEADLQNFELDTTFGLILLPCNTYSTLDAAARRRALKNICRHLRPDGIFAASLPNPALLAEIETLGEPEVEETFAHPDTGAPVQVSSAWTRTDEAMDLKWHYDHLQAGGEVERFTATAIHYIQPTDTHLAEFKSAGLPVVSCYGDFEGRPYRRNSAYLILSAQKAAE